MQSIKLDGTNGSSIGLCAYNSRNANDIKSNINSRQQPSFSSNIPHEKIHKLSDTFLKKSENIHSETSFFAMAEEYFKVRLLNLLKGTKNDSNTPGDLLRLFRHELINNVSSIFELNLNPIYKEYVEDEKGYGVPYNTHQKNTFKQLIHTIKDMTNLWGKIESWKHHPNKEVPFPEIQSVLKEAVRYNNDNKPNISFSCDFDADRLFTANAFEQYNVLSQIILNSIKYSENKPISIKFTQIPEHRAIGDNIYTMIAENHGTTPIRNADIDKILEGSGYRTNDRHVKGTGVGYVEIVEILRRYYHDERTLNLIEKDRKSGVKVIVPFRLENIDNKNKIQNTKNM